MEAKGKKKRVVVIADLHCGHRAGLTPPGWMLNPDNEDDAKWLIIQQEQWKWYVKEITKLRPIHLLLVLGDLVDGVSKKAKGRDTIRVMRRAQVDMACVCLEQAKATNIEMAYGTRYHVEDWEDDIARLKKLKIGSHGFPSVNGLIFDIKHKVGSSQIPHGRSTAISRAQLWNTLWAERKKQPKADLVMRAHVHYLALAGHLGPKGLEMGIVCPPLQGMGSEFGAEQCEGLVDYGFLRFDVSPNGDYDWEPIWADLKSHEAKVTEY